jgi:hypothetical protein
MRYTVLDRRRERAVRVEADTEGEAALRGATKLGLRWGHRRPGTAQRYATGSSLWVVYGPYDRVSNGQHLIGNVMVYGPGDTPPRHVEYV